eukprot:TRINITY_DN1531_c0_g1_i1.p2 TRINITY_DN1531_c0_g1~~TRINITY_DN1531_c0_g1_i1.p2  ORF type:complete len:201 (-),score=17.25 TRINITY_DN1531_c0_g1_i1:503-1105(-)
MNTAIALPGFRFDRMWTNYLKQLQKRPLLTKCATSFVGFGLGDIVAQCLSDVEQYDLTRTVRMSVYGGMVMGPFAHHWFNLLDKVVFPRYPTHPTTVVVKAALDQLVQAPIGLSIFYIYQEALQGRPDRIGETIKEKLMPTLYMTWKFWPMAHLINFSVVPLDLRILYVNVVSVAYTCLLSRLAAEKQEAAPQLSMSDLQ